MANQATIMLRLAANIESLEKELDKAKAKVASTANGMVAPMAAANKKVTDSLATSATAMSKFGQLTGNQRFIIRDVSYQIADMATQLSMGTQVLRVMGQQIPQMLGPMGVLGAVIGTVVAVAAPLIQVFLGTSEQSKTLAQNLSDLDKLLTEYSSLAHDAQLPTDQLAKKYGSATTAARDFISALRDIDQIKKLDILNASIKNLSNFQQMPTANPNDLKNMDLQIATLFEKRDQIMKAMPGPMDPKGQSASIGQRNAIEKQILNFNKLSTAVDLLAQHMKIGHDAAISIAEAMIKLKNAKGLDAQTTAADHLAKSIRAAYPDLAAMPKSVQTLYEKVSRAGMEMAKVSGATGTAADKISAAADAAARLAKEIQNAVNAADSLAGNSALQLTLAKYDQKFAKDPVQKAVARAAATFDAQTSSKYGNAIPDGAARQIAADRAAYLENVRKTAEIQAKLTPQKTGPKSGSKYAHNLDSIFASADNQLAAQQLQIELIGKTGAEAAKLRSEYALLAEARKRNLDLDKIDVNTGRTLRQEIVAKASAIGELTQRAQDYTARQQFMTQQQDALKQGFLDSIVAGKSFGSVLGQVAQQLEKAALQAAIFGDGPLGGSSGGSSSGSGGLFGSILSAIGFRAGGGDVTAGQPYIVGEKQAELFVPNANGTILPSVPKSSTAIGAGPSGKLALQIYMDQGGNWQAKVAQISGMVSAQHISLFSDKVLPTKVVMKDEVHY